MDLTSGPFFSFKFPEIAEALRAASAPVVGVRPTLHPPLTQAVRTTVKGRAILNPPWQCASSVGLGRTEKIKADAVPLTHCPDDVGVKGKASLDLRIGLGKRFRNCLLITICDFDCIRQMGALTMRYEVIVKVGASKPGRDKIVTYTCPNLDTAKDRKALEQKTNPKACIIIMKKRVG